MSVENEKQDVMADSLVFPVPRPIAVSFSTVDESDPAHPNPECTYSRIQLRRMADWHYIEILENRLQRAQNHLKALLANRSDLSPVDIGDVLEPPHEIRLSRQDSGGSPEIAEQDFYLEHLIGSDDRPENDSQEQLDYYGRSSGLAFLHATKGFFDDHTDPSDPRHSSNGKKILELFDSELPGKQALKPKGPVSDLLPSHKLAKEMTTNLFTNGCALLTFIHQPTFDNSMARIYLHEPLTFNDEDHSFLPLLYAVLGLGYIFSQEQHQIYGCERVVWQGVRHFVAAQKTLDIHKCRDLVSLQTIICMIIFLQSTARISTCYSYIGTAVTTAVKLGLHRKTRNGTNPVEQEIRKRVFWTLQKMAGYIGQILGLPMLLNLEDVDQDLPLEVDDEYITSQGIHHQAGNSTVTIQAAANAHTALMLIMAKAVKHLYPVKGPQTESGQGSKTHIVSYAKILEVERDIEQWQQNLPYAQSVVDKLPDYMPSLILQLRIAYTHVQIILYRPFLHYLIQMNSDRLLDERKKRCALACIKASRDTIAIVKEMETQGLVCAASWSSVYTVFLAIVSLIFFTAATRVDDPDMIAAREDADKGMILLNSLKCHDLGPKRCLAVLEIFRRAISGKIGLEQESQTQAMPGPSMLPSVPRFTSNPPRTPQSGSGTGAWPRSTGGENQQGRPFFLSGDEHRQTSFNTEHSGSSGATPANFMSQAGGTGIPDPYGPYSSMPDYTALSQTMSDNMQPDLDAMSIPYMDSLLDTDPGWFSHAEGHQEDPQAAQQSQAGGTRHDVPTSLSQQDFTAVNEIAALMNTYPLNLAQPFDYSEAENP